MKKIIKLPFINTLEERISQGSRLLQVVLGPRQVGKTTTILKFLKKDDVIYESADKVFNSNAEWLTEVWSKAKEANKILIIDEIQKCENWSEVIKSLWDQKEREGIHFTCILLGSSSLEIQKGLSESLTGRFQLTTTYHWNYSQSHEAYGLTLNQYLKFGGYPGSYEFINSPDWVSYVRDSIISTVIEKDILQFNKVKSPSLFKQAFEILTAYPCHEISYTKLLGQIQDKGNVETIKYYIKLYEGAFLIKSLEKFSLNKIRLKASSPKILTMAPSLYYLNIQDEYSTEEKGYAFEALIGNVLLRMGYELFYWREGDYELDFVLKRGRKIWGIEVKSGKKKKAKSMTKFLEKYPDAKPVYLDLDNYIDFEQNPDLYIK